MPALPPGASTVLALTGAGLPPYSARGIKQTLELASIGVSTRRTVNGELVNLAPPQFNKYASKVTGSDVDPPGIDGVFAGALVTVDCIVELSYPTGGTPQRPEVPGSPRVDGIWTFYRPRLAMMVLKVSTDFDEWGAVCQWAIDLEEV